MQKLLFIALATITLNVGAQSQKAKHFELTRDGFNQKNAFKTTAFVEQYFRVPGNTGFNASIYHVENILKKAGYVKQINDEFEEPLTYRIEKRPMKRNTWEPLAASIKIVGAKESLQVYKTNRNMIPINCPSTPKDGVVAEVIYVAKGTEKDLANKELSGKIIFGDASINRLLTIANKSGAIGVLGYAMPSYTQPTKHTSSIQFGAMQANSNVWALMLSTASKQTLTQACQAGTVKLNVSITTKSYPAEELTIIANVRGKVKPNERFVFSAHVQEPGANDNATGVGTLAEMARLTSDLVKSGKFEAQRSLTFLWGDEITSTRRYITDDTTRAKSILWGMSLDMVGENTEKTGGTFLLEKMPDPSAIWTRGDDKHSEWGAGNVSEKDLFPHYFNDFVFDICKEQGKHANWTVKFNPFEGGSDHTPFLQNKIPGLLMWHFTDVFYHTDNDRLDKVSAETMRNVGISALTTALTLSSANEETALEVVNQVKTNAIARLNTEVLLSKQAIAAGKDKASEIHIIKTWANWYTNALATIGQLPVSKETTKVGSAIKFATVNFEGHVATLLKELE